MLTIVAWNWLLDWLAFRFSLIRRFVQPRRLTLVKLGVVQRRNLRREFITMEELNEKLREQGIEKIVRREGRVSRRRRTDQRDPPDGCR